MSTRSFGMLLAASALALLVGCAPATTPTEPDVGGGTPTEESTETESATTQESSAVDGVTLSGTGEYMSGENMPIGGYRLVGDDSEQPAGCTWTLYLSNGDVFVQDQGNYVFITDVTGRFVTAGCPDWQQFE